jgi:hypothetical protein
LRERETDRWKEGHTVQMQEETDLVLHLPDAGGDHDLLEDGALDAEHLPFRHSLNRGNTAGYSCLGNQIELVSADYWLTLSKELDCVVVSSKFGYNKFQSSSLRNVNRNDSNNN